MIMYLEKNNVLVSLSVKESLTLYKIHSYLDDPIFESYINILPGLFKALESSFYSTFSIFLKGKSIVTWEVDVPKDGNIYTTVVSKRKAKPDKSLGFQFNLSLEPFISEYIKTTYGSEIDHYEEHDYD